VTKGGLIYHFTTKDELLGALVEQLTAQIDARNRAKAAERGATPGALLHSLVDDTFQMPPAEMAVLGNLLAAASTYPHLVGPAQRLFQRVYADLAAAGPQAGLAFVLCAAMDGVTMLELLNLHKFSKRERQVMRQALQALIQQID
jgi:AcrR family transcriptional regulator